MDVEIKETKKLVQKRLLNCTRQINGHLRKNLIYCIKL